MKAISKLCTWIKSTKLYKSMSEKQIRSWIIGLIILTVGCVIVLLVANNNMVKYTNKYAKESVLKNHIDSLQRENDLQNEELNNLKSFVDVKIDSLIKVDKIYLNELIKEQQWFNLYKINEYEKIDAIRDIGSDELRRKFSNYKELY